MTDGLEGKVAIVTGGSRGIGAAVARELAASGARVVITSRDREAAESAAAGFGPEVAGFGAHAADPEAARACAEFAIERFGALDLLVNNAGTNPAFGPLVEIEQERFAKTVDVNLWAPLLWTGVAWRAWMAEHGGAIVNTSSIGGLAPEAGLGVYNVTKAALIHLTRQLALELGPRVRVNAVAPGVVRTRLSELLWEDEAGLASRLPLGRIGEPPDVAAAVAFLASERAGWITGETLLVDGGQLLGQASSPPSLQRAVEGAAS